MITATEAVKIVEESFENAKQSNDYIAAMEKIEAIVVEESKNGNRYVELTCNKVPEFFNGFYRSDSPGVLQKSIMNSLRANGFSVTSYGNKTLDLSW